MRQQHEITTSGPLLGSDGNLLEPGWARSLLPVYRRADIKASAMRIKEWDYYLITDGHIGLALTIADNGYMGLDSVSFLDFDGKWEKTTSRMRALPARPDAAAGIERGGRLGNFKGRLCTHLLSRGRGADALVPHGQIPGQGAHRGASSSSPTSRTRAWLSPRPSISPAISTTTRRSTACAPKAGSNWAAAGMN